MPELPEVETIRRSLLPHLVGLPILGCEIYLPKLLQNLSAEEFSQSIRGRHVEDILRRGKYLVLRLSGGYTLVVHLRMTGQLRFVHEDAPCPPHTHIVLKFAAGMVLRYTDIRQFGYWFLAPDSGIEQVARLERLGVEPLALDFTVGHLEALLSGRRGKIKAVLLDQARIAGVGNIYADEALFGAGLHPARAAGSLAPEEIARLHRHLQEVLNQGILMRGTTLRDYVDGSGESGGFQHKLKVYGQKGQPCSKCQTPIARLVIAGRGTHLCPNCQV
ncbi:MAG: bifunctional DNA-formamidopyrimidine glycosylase/DNA-(apurinic or apyrimidinic site) lyase [Thermaerobacter sp.]|nr:bifunctional DNA-formamidopyrimidine glycosylase/DNA-(apurinic or apyrimidinic site) lyase [Thermaerobacter sp.]